MSADPSCSAAVEAVWEPTYEDIKQVVRLTVRSGWMVPVGLGLATVCIVLSVVMQDSSFAGPALLGLAAVSVVIALTGLVLKPLTARSMWKDQPGLRRTTRYRLTAGGVDGANDLVEGAYRWAAFLKAVESDTLFVLTVSSGMQTLGVVVPKRSFASEDDVATARALIAANLTDFKKV